MGNLNHNFYENYELVEISRGVFVSVFNEVLDNGVLCAKISGHSVCDSQIFT
jgi:hypothetical protein